MSAPSPHTAAGLGGSADRPVVAVVGMGVAVPGASAPEELWSVLTGNTPMFSEPGSRFDLDRFWSSDPDAEDRTYARTAGYVHGFRPHPALREEEERDGSVLAQEARWLRHALLQAQEGVRPVAGDRHGLYVGAWPGGSQSLMESAVAAEAGRGLSDRSTGALREHYRHTVEEPRTALPDGVVRATADGIADPLAELLVVDTACSSSLYSVDLGAKALLAGDCDVAYCGGVSALDPTMSVMFAKLRGLSPTGRVRTFDEAADGTLFSDGAGIVTLKLLSRAAADGDRILGVLSGFGAAADGRGKSVSAPNPAGQERAVRRARAVGPTDPEQIDWVIAHGTGTPVGDASELGVLDSLAPSAGYVCSANKPLIGHTGWSAGVVSLMHALLALRHECIPAQVSAGSSPGTAGEGVRIPVADVPFPVRADRPRTVGISAFGFGGTNAHLLVSDRPDRPYAGPAASPRSNLPTTSEAPVLVAWSTQLPGEPGTLAVRDWLRGQGSPPARSFGLPYPAPAPADVRLPPRTLRAIDPGQVMALQVAARFAEEHGALWEDLRESTGVIAAHMGLPRLLTGTALRCYADDLTGALEGADGQDRAALERRLAEVREAVPACSEDTQAGVLTNVIASRVAARFDLHGATFAVDTGLTGTHAALRAARRYLRTGELDLALVLAVNGDSGRTAAEITGVPRAGLAEGAFLLALTGESTARERGWPVLGRLDEIEARAAELPEEAADSGYLAAGGAVRLLRAAEQQAPAAAHSLSAPQPPAAQPGRDDGEALTDRYLPALTPDPLTPGPSAEHRQSCPALPHRGIVLIDGDPVAPAVREQITRSQAVVVSAGPTEVPGALVIEDPAEDSGSRLDEHLRGAEPLLTVLCDLDAHTARLPQPPAPEVLRLHDLMFLITRQMPASPGASSAVLLAGHTPVAGSVHPYAALFTGFAKSLAWERPEASSFAVLTDGPLAGDALNLLSAERGGGTPPVVSQYLNGVRHTEELRPTPLSGQSPLPVGDDSVVVVTGGTGGVPVALLHALARHVRPRVWLLGRTPQRDLPAALCAEDGSDHRALRTRLLRTLQEQGPDRPVRELVAEADALLKARTVQTALDGLRKAFGTDRVRYMSCDLLDPVAVSDTVDEILRTEERVDLVIHAAGLFRPALVESKTLESFRQVRDTKVRGYHHLLDALGDRPPQMWCNIGSYAGVAGMPGDTDYSAANAYLASAGGQRRGAAVEHTVAFTLWRDTGLGTEPKLRERLEREGLLTSVSTGEAARQFLNELREASEHAGTGAYLGDRERRMLREGSPRAVRVAEAEPALPESGPPATAAGPSGPVDRGTPVRSAPGAPSSRPDWLTTRTPGPSGSAQWHRVFSPGTDTFLHDHLVDGKPTLPGTFMLEIAAQAAEDLRTGLVTTGFRDASFDIFARPFAGSLPFTLRIEADGITTSDAPEDGARVRVTLSSDLLGPDGSLIRGARRHFRTDVLLAPPGSRGAPRFELPGHIGEPVPDPYYAEDSPVRLSGAFHNTADGHAGEAGARSTWSPDLRDEEFLRTANIPALLICSTLRTTALHPSADGQQRVLVPRALGGLDLFSDGANDLELAARHGRSLTLVEGTDAAYRALDREGNVLMEIRDVELAEKGTVAVPRPDPYGSGGGTGSR